MILSVQEDERDKERQKLRDKYNLAKPVNEDEESEDEDDSFGTVGKKKEEAEDDPVARKKEAGGARWEGEKQGNTRKLEETKNYLLWSNKENQERRNRHRKRQFIYTYARFEPKRFYPQKMSKLQQKWICNKTG